MEQNKGTQVNQVHKETIENENIQQKHEVTRVRTEGLFLGATHEETPVTNPISQGGRAIHHEDVMHWRREIVSATDNTADTAVIWQLILRIIDTGSINGGAWDDCGTRRQGTRGRRSRGGALRVGGDHFNIVRHCF
jgi:hypothetical protein